MNRDEANFLRKCVLELLIVQDELDEEIGQLHARIRELEEKAKSK